MVTFLDGPAMGANLMLRRAPLLLRVTLDASGRGHVDALDLLGDEPLDTETIHVYRRHSYSGSFHIRASRRAGSGCFQMAEYVHVPDVDGERLRDTVAWREWCEQQPEAEVAIDG